MKEITPFLWFNVNAEEAAGYYTSILPNSKILNVVRGSGPMGPVNIIAFSLGETEFTALSGGPEFAFSPAVSFVVACETQAEIDRYWERLSAGGEEQQCGWLKDRFGLTWQIVPEGIEKLLYGPDPEGSKRAVQAMLKMKKLDIAELKKAYDGK
jgi:predicted 3-demethylubiquinone-9 3-methyltransferase (glyoxalase superfamily)